MNPYKLVGEIIKTCKYFEIIDCKNNDYYIEKKIYDGLHDVIFVENLLCVFYSKIKSKKFKKCSDNNRFKKLLLELEKIRLDLEF